MNKMNNKGFSLVELIVVIAIMAVLMGVLAPTLIGNIEKSRESTDLQNLDTIKSAVTTAMSNEAVYKEVMAAAGTTGKVISLGSSGSATFTSTDLNGLPKLQAELQATVLSDIKMKSTAATATGCCLNIEVTSAGAVSVYVGTSATAASTTAVDCTKTKDENDAAKKLISK